MDGECERLPELVPIKRLKPAPWNPRILRTERFKNLCRSIQADPEFMRLRPILAQSDGTIYGGNQRYRAAQHLKHTEVWAEIDDVPDRVARERALRDNQQWGEWQEDQLSEILAGLHEQESSLDILGFEDDELERMLALSGIGGRESTIPEELPASVESMAMGHQCPKCGYEWN
jgi:ParB-like chromosome segregation protein Spo0J